MGSATFDASHIKSLTADVNSTLQDPSTLDEEGRVSAFAAAKRLADALETPQDAITQQWLMVSLSRVILSALSLLLLR